MAEPVLVTFMGVFILSEAMNLRDWVGFLVLIGALALLSIVGSPTRKSLETANA